MMTENIEEGTSGGSALTDGLDDCANCPFGYWSQQDTLIECRHAKFAFHGETFMGKANSGRIFTAPQNQSGWRPAECPLLSNAQGNPPASTDDEKEEKHDD